jgi:hypothetical protein
VFEPQCFTLIKLIYNVIVALKLSGGTVEIQYINK